MNEPYCPACGVAYTDHLGLSGTCTKLQEEKRRANDAVIEVGKYSLYRRNGILWLEHQTDEGAAVKLDGARERAFEIGLEKIFDAYSD